MSPTWFMTKFLSPIFDTSVQKMCNTAVPAIPLHQYKRNWPITCDLPEIWSVLCGAFHLLPGIYNLILYKVRKRAQIRYRYNIAPHLTQDTNGKVTTSQLDITNESQEAIPFPAGDHKASINRRAPIFSYLTAIEINKSKFKFKLKWV